jgi:hypothetical protein
MFCNFLCYASVLGLDSCVVTNEQSGFSLTVLALFIYFCIGFMS